MVLMDRCCWNLSGRADYRISLDYRSFSSTKAPTQMPMVSVVQATFVKGSTSLWELYVLRSASTGPTMRPRCANSSNSKNEAIIGSSGHYHVLSEDGSIMFPCKKNDPNIDDDNTPVSCVTLFFYRCNFQMYALCFSIAFPRSFR